MTDYYCTLAKTYNPDKHNVLGWMWSEKLDGVRALWRPDEGRFVSRSNKPLNVPPSWLEMMKNVRVPLDGEFFMGRGRFSDTISAVRKKAPTEEQFKGVQYVVFDIVENGIFVDRITRAAQITNNVDDPRIYTLAHRIVGCMGDLLVEYGKIMTAGGEGIMFRNPNMGYDMKRSGKLLKMKGEIDGKATVREIQPGVGKHVGRMGALVVDCFTTPTQCVQFKVGTGFTDEQREAEYPVGTVIRWRAMELTKDGIPRCPVFVCIDEGD